MIVEAESVKDSSTARKLLAQLLFALLAGVIACTMYYVFVVNTARVTVEIEVSESSPFGIYWAEEGKGYKEKNIATFLGRKDKSEYSFYLTNISKIRKLRIDPHCYVGEISLKRLEITQEGYEPIILDTPKAFEQLVPLNQIADTRADAEGMWIRSTGTDPNLELNISPKKVGMSKLWLLARLLGIGLVVFAVVYTLVPFLDKLKIVPVLLFGVWILVLVMAGISKQNAHPDEYVHIAATSYYADNWLPPVIDDPSVRNTYSVYGISRLNNGEIYYLLSGKTYKLLQLLEVPRAFGCRFFNVALFGIIFLFSIRSVYARIAAIPYLVSSQVWYVFSYCNSDAFALFLAFISTVFLIDPQSFLHRYLKGGTVWLQTGVLLLLSVFFGAIFTVKMNYYPFVGLVFLILGIRILFTEEYYWEKKASFIRLVVLIILALGFFGLRTGADYAVNGLDKDEKIALLQQDIGADKYKKSTPIEERGRSMYMKDRGVSFKELISQYHWEIKTFQSSFGVFGYLSNVSSHHFYTMVKWAGTGLLLFILIASLARGGYLGAGITVMVCSLSTLLILAALHRSWVVDFQPQGRYLFPILPMFGIVLGHNIKALNKNILVLLMGLMFTLGVYSFIFQGLLKIPKLPY